MDEEKADYTAREAEARLIAAKIRELTDPESGMQIYNGKTGQYERLKKKEYRDPSAESFRMVGGIFKCSRCSRNPGVCGV